jgi:hypothetical protein
MLNIPLLPGWTTVCKGPDLEVETGLGHAHAYSEKRTNPKWRNSASVCIEDCQYLCLLPRLGRHVLRPAEPVLFGCLAMAQIVR